MTSPVRIAVIGCADIARRRMLPAMIRAAGTEVVAVASRDRAKAEGQAARFGCRPVHGYAEVLGLDDVEAVYLPLPMAMHAEWTAAALSAGKHVLAEKPLAAASAHTASLFRLAKAKGLALMENVMFIHHAQHAAVRRLIGAGVIGEPRAFHAAFTIPALPEGNIRYDPELGGGALADVGIYPVRAALSFFGPAVTVTGAILSSGRGREVDTAGAALLRAPGEATAQLTFGLDHAYNSSYELCGSEGRLTLNHAFTPPPGQAPVVLLEDRDGAREIRLEPDDQVANTVAAFAAAARAGQCPDEEATIRQAELLDEVRRRATAEPAALPGPC